MRWAWYHELSKPRPVLYFPLTCFAREPRVTYILVSTWKNKISSRIVYYQEMKHWPCNDKKDCIVLSSDNITHPKVEMQLSCHLSFLLGFSPIESSFNCLLFNPLGYSSLFISLLLTFASLAQAPQFLIKLYIYLLWKLKKCSTITCPCSTLFGWCK